MRAQQNYIMLVVGINKGEKHYHDVKTGNDDDVSARFRGNIQVNQTDQTSRAYGFLSTDDGSTIFGVGCLPAVRLFVLTFPIENCFARPAPKFQS